MKLYVANAGDCRAVLGRGGEALSLSCDHKPELDVERARIEAAGGIVHQVRGVEGPAGKQQMGCSHSHPYHSVRSAPMISNTGAWQHPFTYSPTAAPRPAPRNSALRTHNPPNYDQP